MIELTEVDAGSTVSVDVGDTVRLRLAENAGTGHVWRFDEPDATSVVLVARGQRVVHTEPRSAVRVGQPVIREFEFVAMSPGSERIHLTFGRSWDDLDARDVTIHVDVTGR